MAKQGLTIHPTNGLQAHSSYATAMNDSLKPQVSTWIYALKYEA